MDANNVAMQEELLAKQEFGKEKVAVIQQLPQELVGNKQAYFISKDNSMIILDASGLLTGKGVTINKRALPTHRDGNMGQLLADMEKEDLDFSRDKAVRVVHKMMMNLPHFDSMVEQVNNFDNTKEGQQELFDIFMEEESEHIVKDKILNQRVQNVVELLESGVSKNDTSVLYKPYKYYVHDDTDINAMCSMGRIIRVNKGLLDCVSDNDELLAAVLAHEMGHGESNHHAYSSYDLGNIQLGAAMLAAATNDKALGMDAMHIVLNQMKKATSIRVAEREADYLAFGYMVDAGLNPGALPAFFQRMQDRESDSDEYKNFNGNVSDTEKGRKLDTIINPHEHPHSDERTNNASKLLSDYSNGHITMVDGTVCIDGKPLVKPTFESVNENSYRTSMERAYLVMGNLAVAYHNGLHKEKAYAKDNSVMLGNQLIMECNEDDVPAVEVVKTLNDLNSKVQDKAFVSELDTAKNPVLMQFDENGKSVNLPYIESNDVVKVVRSFSDKISETMSAVSQIDRNASDEIIGQQTGKIFANLLGSQEALDFVKVMRNQVKENTTDLESLYHGYAGEEISFKTEADATQGNAKILANHHRKEAESKKNTMLHLFRLSPHSDTVKSSDLNTGNEDFSYYVNYRSNPNLIKAMQKAVADNPKALDNLKKIEKLGDQMANDMEIAQFNVLGAKNTGYMNVVEQDLTKLSNSLKKFDAQCKAEKVDTRKSTDYMYTSSELGKQYNDICELIGSIAPKVNAVSNALSKGNTEYALALDSNTLLQYDELGKRISKMHEIEQSYKNCNLSSLTQTMFTDLKKESPFQSLTEEQQKIVLKGKQYAKDHEEVFMSGQLPYSLDYNAPTGEKGSDYFARFTNYMNGHGFGEYLNEEINCKASELMCNMDVRYDSKGKAEYISRTKMDALDSVVLTHSLGKQQKEVYSNLILTAKSLVLNDGPTTLRTSEKNVYEYKDDLEHCMATMQQVQQRNKKVIVGLANNATFDSMEISPQFIEKMAGQIDREKRQELGLVKVAEKTGNLVKHNQNNKHKVVFER